MHDASQSTHSISAANGVHLSTISRLCSEQCSELQKPTGGHPKKLFPSNIHHAIHLISTQRAEMLSSSPKLSPPSLINLSPQASFIFTSIKLVCRLWSRPNTLSSLPDITKHVWCKGVHSLMPDLGRFSVDDGLVAASLWIPPEVWTNEVRRWDWTSWNEPRSDWRTPSWRLGVRTSELLIHSARGHISLCYHTNR